MRNLTTVLQQEGLADLHAQKAIRRIFLWMEKNYPSQPAMSKSILIRQCLMDLTMERSRKQSDA